LNQALDLRREIGERSGQADTLNNIGMVYRDLGDKQKAMDYYNQALPVYSQAGDRGNQAHELINLGIVHSDLGERQKALDYYNQALAMAREASDRASEAGALNNLGIVYQDIGQSQKALEYYDQSLQLNRQLGDLSGEAETLNNIGNVYSGLGEKRKALDYYSQAMPIYRQAGDLTGQAGALGNVGNTFDDLKQLPEALDSFNQALSIFRQLGDRGGEAAVLDDIGIVYDDLGQKQTALDYYAQALPLYLQVGNRDGESGVRENMGVVYDSLGEPQKALNEYHQALPLATAVNSPILEAAIFNRLLFNLKVSQPALAIFYGKQAVNRTQQVRANIQGLDKGLQASFLASKDSYYRDLADLLIAQGRLPEAEQVLDLEKQQEYSDYVRGEAADTLSPLALTAAERQAEEEYQKSTEALVSTGQQWAQLKKNTARTAEQEKQFQELSDQLKQASKGLDVFYSRLYEVFGKTTSANNQVRDVKGPVSDLKRIIAKMPHTTALYTLVGKDRTSIIVIAGSADVPAVVRESAISEVELNKKVAAFQQVLRQPGQDPRPLAQELYKVLIGPVKADLDQAKAETLVWSLDGVLRYVPMAALYDGKQYVVENYNTVTISPTSIANLADLPDMTNLSTVAMGISRKYEEGLPALPAVAGELGDVVKDAKVQGANGALTGTILLDGQFTEKAMENQLGAQPTVVHIASHFVYSPTGDASKSYLLLAGKDQGGAAFHLTVEDFRDNANLSLSETALLTLSACETGMSGNANGGKEVDGLGMTAEYKGAKAVISSLWSVNDASTGQLMGDFYKRWAEGAGKVPKVEALRQAQLDLLLGKARVQGDGSDRGFGTSKREGPAPAGYAHPFYWAPFVLMGNWR
jgi:CHAT domain-containing protein/Tfp pilus assembly protein PilF